jgi:hypothetical protein
MFVTSFNRIVVRILGAGEVSIQIQTAEAVREERGIELL